MAAAPTTPAKQPIIRQLPNMAYTNKSEKATFSPLSTLIGLYLLKSFWRSWKMFKGV